MAAARDRFVAALDVGSSKVCCFIARQTDDGGVRVVGIGHQVSTGLKAGVVVDMEETETSIRTAVDAAERMAGVPISEVYVNLAFNDMQSEGLAVDVAVEGHEIGTADILNVLDRGRALFDARGREIIHALPVSYAVDDALGVREPRGLIGDRLGVEMHVVTAAASPIRNLEACVARGHLQVAGFVSSPYAAGLSSLVEDEKDLGVVLVDMGGGTTSIAVFLEGAMAYTAVIPVGGQHVTNDIARGLLTPVSHAERMKTLFGSALPSASDDREIIDVPQVGEQDVDSMNRIPRSMLTGIIRPRLEETFELVRDCLRDSGFDQMAGRRVVLTGGASQLPGTRDLATRVLDKRVRVGQPLTVSGLADVTQGPAFSTCAGLLTYAINGPLEAQARPAMAEPRHRLARVGRWLRDNF